MKEWECVVEHAVEREDVEAVEGSPISKCTLSTFEIGTDKSVSCFYLQHSRKKTKTDTILRGIAIGGTNPEPTELICSERFHNHHARVFNLHPCHPLLHYASFHATKRA